MPCLSGPGAAVTVAQLETDPHPVLARLRAQAPVAHVPAIDGWLVTRHDLVVEALRDAATFTVDDPRFTTSRVVGPSMLSLDGEEHARHRAPFTGPFRPREVRERFAAEVAEEAARRADELAATGGGELRRAFAGPLSATTVALSLGLARDETPAVLGWYEAIVGSVNGMSAGRPPTQEGAAAYRALAARLLETVAADTGQASLLAAAAAGSGLTEAQLCANAAILLFGGIETTEGMIANALVMLLQRPDVLAAARADPGVLDAAIEESLRLEPAAAALDRYATTEAVLGGVTVPAGSFVRLSVSAANRDPAVFTDPDAYDLERSARGHLAFAQGPHVCVGVHLARLEARAGIAALLARLPGLRLDPAGEHEIRGLVFRKPPRLDCLWSAEAA
ncbi:MAG TPA: cytochrome P450 [Solirubrobacteraceae bacterium]|nr:cytochrome P450 [Solirubrobacteraceae bacterium]